ncbi:YitT family protein [Sporosarcina sp. NCCP-2222]|uniref:YitT family protein n=1 Tax=Sporosarcina sp. NCCP-2222 TaxID=2935073 RepID=UPI002083C833|nr:YitT family protein [Sporosarcina sp. NCCP-2222]GKV54774.1 YitT family protein [Sporosarcina sp. NCCP-2222]
MKREHKKEKFSDQMKRYLLIAIGATLAAVALELFLIPNSVIDGGIIGISLLLNIITGIPFGILILLINLPFLFFGFKHIGKSFFVSSVLAIALLAIIEFPLKSVGPFVTDPLLATVFGGLILGAGVGLVIRNGGALDGTEILGILLTRRIPFSVGEFVMFLNIFIFGWAGFVLTWEKAMYSILTYYIASKMIDMVIQGLDETKAIIIVSDEYEELSEAIVQRLGRSVTKLHGRGGISDNEKDVIYVVVTRLEISKLKQIVRDVDPTAFVTIMNTQETHGATFKSAIH